MADRDRRHQDEDDETPDKAPTPDKGPGSPTARPLTPGQREAQRREQDKEQEAQRAEAARRQHDLDEKAEAQRQRFAAIPDEGESATTRARREAAQRPAYEAQLREGERRHAEAQRVQAQAPEADDDAPPVEQPALAAMTLSELYDHLDAFRQGKPTSMPMEDVVASVRAAIHAQAPDYQELACRLLMAPELRITVEK
jgi:hypothetical protein